MGDSPIFSYLPSPAWEMGKIRAISRLPSGCPPPPSSYLQEISKVTNVSQVSNLSKFTIGKLEKFETLETFETFEIRWNIF